MNFKRITLCFLCCLSFLVSRAEQGWIDVTDQYVVNADYNNNTDEGWTAETNAWSNVVNYGAREFWNGAWYYYQSTEVPNGHYRLSVQAYYRYSDNSASLASEWQSYDITSMLFANDAEVPLKNIYSESLDENYAGNCWGYTEGGWNGTTKYYPNGMASGAYCFSLGMYKNELEFDVVDGQLIFGIYNFDHINANWCMMDNWKLEYYGEMVSATSVKMSTTKLTIGVAETSQLSATISPANATIKKLIWASSDESVATVDQQGNVVGVSPGTAKITATATDGSNRKGTCTVTVEFNGAKPGILLVNELMAANVDMYVDPSWNYGSWLELYNPTDQYVTVGGYWASDDPENLKKALIHKSIGGVSAHSYTTLWFDHADTRKDVGEKWVNTQVDMKLNCEGGTIYISDNDGNIIVQQEYPQAVMRCSYARRTDGGNEWSFSAAPTPGETNVGMTFADTQLEEPVVNLPGQLFSGSLKVKVTIPNGATLRYTTDGTTPTDVNGMTSTTGSFNVSATTTYRFRLYQDGFLPSKVVTRSYIYNDMGYYLPVVSLVTDEKNLYDNTIGIYVTGKNGKTANQDYTKRNFNMEWDRPASFEYIANGHNAENVDGYFAQEVDIAINGGWSRKYEPRSFKVKSGKQYDLKNSLDYPFFADKPYNKNKSLLLRNGGNDEYNQTRMKDASLQQIARVSEFPLNLQSYQPTHVFVNGSYLGMLNLREPSNKHYGYANYGIDTDEIDAFEMSVDSGYVQKSGTKEMFRQWYTLSANAADELAYQQILDIVDVDDYINYMAFKFFLNDWDWPHNNAKGFRDRNDGKFRFIIFDLDNCVDKTGNNIFNDFQNKKSYTFYGRPEYNGSSITAEVELVTLFLNMLKNEQFKKKFIDTYCLVGGSVFGDEDEIADVVNGIADNIAEALSWEWHSPYGTGRSFAQGIINAVTGNYRKRMIDVMRAYRTFGLSNTEPADVSIKCTVPGASVTVNDIVVPRNKFDGYLFAPAVLKATAPAGYKFTGWITSGKGKNERSIFDKSSQWEYYGQGSLDGEDWTSIDYNTKNWKKGSAPFGYGNSGRPMSNATTQLSKSDANGKRIPTYYFRKEFTLDNEPTEQNEFHINYELDDSYIIYVNGVEVSLYHMWSGARYDETCQARGNDDWYEGENPRIATISVPAEVLHKGKNLLAVEVHNCNDTSSDLWWDASMSVLGEIAPDANFVQDTELELFESASISVVPCFDPLEEDELAENNITPIRINEVSAGNSVNVNDYYKKDDWVELYNTTDKDIDLKGMFLTDKKSNHQKYAVTGANTIIPAHGYKVVWCSKREDMGREIHANFKLDNEDGKMVRIEAADGSWADSLVYCKHLGMQSVGRYPDGSNNVYLMTQTTINATNIYNSQSQEWEFVPSEEPETAIDNMMASSDGMHLRFVGNDLILTGCTASHATVRLYSLAGASVATRVVNVNGDTRISISTLSAGTYVARVTDANGNEVAVKFKK